MTIPAPVLTMSPTTVTRTYADLVPEVTLGDSSTPSPVATGREFQFDTVTVKSTVGATGAGIATAVKYGVNLAAGTRQGRVRTTNTDGTGTSANVALTVVDSVGTGVVTTTDSNNAVRQYPSKLPNEYQDPTLVTPGVVTATGVYNARTRGVI